MNIEVSIGEVVDKYSILELKRKKIRDPIKLVEISKELATLDECRKIIDKNRYYYKLLLHINERIWDMTDEIKAINISNVSNVIEKYKQYAIISKNIFDDNQKRFRIKRIFNMGSNIKEQKSYAETICKIIIPDQETAQNKIAEINYISIEYDGIVMDDQYKKMFPYITNFLTDQEKKEVHTIDIRDFDLDENDKLIYSH